MTVSLIRAKITRSSYKSYANFEVIINLKINYKAFATAIK